MSGFVILFFCGFATSSLLFGDAAKLLQFQSNSVLLLTTRKSLRFLLLKLHSSSLQCDIDREQEDHQDKTLNRPTFAFRQACGPLHASADDVTLNLKSFSELTTRENHQLVSFNCRDRFDYLLRIDSRPLPDVRFQSSIVFVSRNVFDDHHRR